MISIIRDNNNKGDDKERHNIEEKGDDIKGKENGEGRVIINGDS